MSMPRMNNEQYRKAQKLVRECCNYNDGNCLALDDGETHVCVQSVSYSLLCKLFLSTVLPLDKLLYAELTERSTMKRCSDCGELFVPPKKNSLYCLSCAAKRKRKSKEEWARQNRAMRRKSNAQNADKYRAFTAD